MSELPGQHPRKLPINLGERIDTAMQMGTDDFEMHHAVSAAQRLADELVDQRSEINFQTDKIEKLEQEASIDHKTGLLNEKTWKGELSSVIEVLQPDDQLTVFVSDINGFKAVNDALGHEVGDELLGIVGEAFRDTFRRDSDSLARGSREDNGGSIARLGGDEYGLFTVRKAAASTDNKRTATQSEEATLQANRVNQSLAERLVGTKFESFAPSLAVGFATFEPGDSAEKIFARADIHMFTTKYQHKIDKITATDRAYLQDAIPYFEKVGARVETWLKEAVLANPSQS